MSRGDRVLIIAEAGVNHNGSRELALRLVDAAVDAGADIVKFQTWKTEYVVTRDSSKAPYQLSLTDNNETQFEMLKKMELTYDDFRKIKKYCDQKKISFLSTADEIESATFLNSIQSMFKIGSAELNDLPFLGKLAKFNKPILLSTGMGTLGEIESAIGALMDGGLQRDHITILHCNTEYPTPYQDVNLQAMITIKKAFNVNVGYSDHTLGIEIPIAAVAMGASVIEKHFTLDKDMEGPDHRSSLEPGELKMMVESIRNVEKSFGNGIKRPMPSELGNMSIIRKSIVASKKIRKGDFLTEHNIAVKRPGTGISPSLWGLVIGKKAMKEFDKDELITI